MGIKWANTMAKYERADESGLSGARPLRLALSGMQDGGHDLELVARQRAALPREPTSARLWPGPFAPLSGSANHAMAPPTRLIDERQSVARLLALARSLADTRARANEEELALSPGGLFYQQT